MGRCAVPHPTLDLTCIAPKAYPNHDHHFAGDHEWPNENFVPPALKPSKEKRDEVKANIAVLANGLRNTRKEAVARTDDPETSWETAKALGDLTEAQVEVLALFDEHGPMMDEQVAMRAEAAGIQQTPSGLRTRRSELVEGGYLYWTGEYGVKSDTGRESRVWGRVSESVAVPVLRNFD